jgi:hypothetical protein
MLTLSTTLTPGNLLRQALLMLNSDNPRSQDAYDLASLAGVESSTVELFVKVGELLAQKGRIELASELLCMVDVKKAYAENPCLKDLHARIGWVQYWKNNEHKKLQNCFEKDMYWPDTRFDTSRLSTSFLSRYAMVIAKNQNIKAALPFIKKAYEDDPVLENAYSQVAWQHFIPKDMAFDKTIPYFEKDLMQGRLKDQWQLHYAQALAFQGRIDEAARVVADAYAQNDNIRNGYAMCANAYFLMRNFSPEKALRWFEKDHSSDRLTIFFRHFIMILARLSNAPYAEYIIEKKYTDDNQANSAYSYLGWHHHIVNENNFEAANIYFERDKKKGRFNPFYAGAYYAGLQACLGRRDKAEKLIESYSLKASALGGSFYIFIGLCDYTINFDLDYLRKMCEKETFVSQTPRIVQEFLFSAVLFKGGEKERAIIMLKDIACRNIHALQLTTSWLVTNCPSGETIVDEFMSPQFSTLFHEFAGCKYM